MVLPEMSMLSIDGATPSRPMNENTNDAAPTDRYIQKLKTYAKSLPYSIEPLSKMMQLLDFIILRLVQCVEAKDYDVGLVQWDSMLSYWRMLKHPIPKGKRVQLAKLYYHASTIPGMSTQLVATCADAFHTLTKSKKKLTIEDMRLPWKPVYEILKADLFLTRRQFEYTQLSWCMGYIADNARRFFSPAAIEEMLSTFVPLIDGTKLDSVLAPQYYLLTFLPLTHPQSYLPMLFRMWESINSYMYDERMLQFLARLAEMHVNPTVSDPRKIAELPDDERVEGEDRPRWAQEDIESEGAWTGLYKDVGIFSEHEWHLLMCKCLASMEIPLADAGSLTTGPNADSQAGFEIGRLPKPTWRIISLARIIVYSMAPDGAALPPSNAPTPMFSPLPSGMNTPQVSTNNLKEFLAAPLGKQGGPKKYVAGSKALDSLAKLIASTESFFHPSNSGAWTNDLSAFVKYIVYDFNKRWHEEQQPDCETPPHRRLTRAMKRELVKSLRTVTLLAMFSQDSTTVQNIQSCLKSMCVMEPDLILHPILQRAVPSLEALVETQRTIAVIKALGAVAPAIVNRQVYYPGAKHLVPILELLIPGIDLNDPGKTLCTTAFLVEVSQCIEFGDLTRTDETRPITDAEPTLPPSQTVTVSLPAGATDEMDEQFADIDSRLSDEEEDALLKDSTGSFPDWVASFLRRVIQLLENLPDEGPDGTAGGATEAQIVDAVTGACSQICVHLSEPLYDLVLNMIFDYASTTVRPNAVRAIHQLVECVANANPTKTLAKFFHLCAKNIRTELENGASSLRTTSVSSPLPSDATLHWNLAILRGTIYNDGRPVLKYKDDLLSLLQILHDKTFSKRGYSWTGKLLSSTLLTLTHTYPLENKFVNPEEWESPEFQANHHQHWGKLYAPEEVTISWHRPNEQEIQFALDIFKTLVEPTLTILEGLVQDGVVRDEVWRNDFCRHLCFVRNAFSGIPSLMHEKLTPEQVEAATLTSDILDEIPEMIASIEPLESGFCLTDPQDPRYQYMASLKERFGHFLHKASVSLRQQGAENTVDAVATLIRAVRTYLLEYGDSRDSYGHNEEQFRDEKNVARHHAHQKIWPRAIYVRRARYYHSARLHWNSIERRRSPLEDALIDDVVEWSIWHYAGIRRASQSLLESICEIYDGVRRRALPVLLKALEPGTDDDRMKGALWTINSPYIGKYAISEPTLAPEIIRAILGCQHNEKASIQDCVSAVAENCLSSFLEPCYLVYEIPTPRVDKVLGQLKADLDIGNHPDDGSLVMKCRNKRIERVQKCSNAVQHTIAMALEIGNSERTHWRYEILVTRCLRTLIRRDAPTSSEHLQFFMDRVHDDHPTIRYYAQRAATKAARNIKLRTFCISPADLALMRTRNPLKTRVVVDPSHQLTSEVLAAYRKPFDLDQEIRTPLFLDQDPPGWLVWEDSITLYLPPSRTKSPFQAWDPTSKDALEVFRKSAVDTSYWGNVVDRYSEENHETAITQDNVSFVKSIFQLLGDEPLEALRPTMEKMIKDKDQNKQRAAAELVAGVIGGSKHWPTAKQQNLWKWFTPFISQIFGQNIKTDTLSIWTSFCEYIFYHKDPRRVQPLVDYISNEFHNVDFNAEMTFDPVKVLSLFRAFYEELGRKFIAWTDDTLARSWKEIGGEHADVRAYIAEILAFTQKIKWSPKPSAPTTEVFVKECRDLPAEFDIMGMRGVFHKDRVLELVDQFKVWREKRLPGVHAFQSTYDRVGVTVCKWLYQSVHDVYAISTYDYILPLMPELFRFTELHDNNELAARSSTLLVRMCGVTPPRLMVDQILDAIFEAIQKSPSWRIRLKALPLCQVFYFRQVPLINDYKIVEMLEVICECLDDEVVEVREMAAATLSGILRLSPRRSVLVLRDRFVRLAKSSHIPPRHHPDYNKAIRQRHAAILGICALIESYPYTVEKWMPELLTDVLAEHTYDPIPISTTVRKCAANFKRTHQDTWHEDAKRFNEDQLAALSTLLTGSSYYA